MNVKLDKYPKVDLLRSKNVQTANAASRYIGVLDQEHLNWIDWTEVFFALQGMKAERGWYNLELRLEDLKYLMANPSWYELSIPEDRLNFHDLERMWSCGRMLQSVCSVAIWIWLTRRLSRRKSKASEGDARYLL